MFRLHSGENSIMKVMIRPARREDRNAFLALVDALADYEKLKRPTRSARLRLIRDGFGRHRRFDPILALVDGKAAGYAIVFETYSSFLAKPTLYLEDIFVAPAYRGKRIGLTLFQRCLHEARLRGCARLDWIVLDWNKPAIAFYEKIRARRLDNWLLYRITL